MPLQSGWPDALKIALVATNSLHGIFIVGIACIHRHQGIGIVAIAGKGFAAKTALIDGIFAHRFFLRFAG
jgi:hypothetical protein